MTLNKKFSKQFCKYSDIILQIEKAVRKNNKKKYNISK